MNRKKLIARKIQEYWPVKIAKKNWYKDKNHKTFKGWTEREGTTDVADNQFAIHSQVFLKKRPFAFIVGCQLDIGKKAWKAWRGPLMIAKEIGQQNFNPTYISNMHAGTLRAVITRTRLGARTLPAPRAAMNMKKLAELICNEYGKKAQNIWEKAQSFDELKERLFELPGFGVKLVNMTCKLLLELGMVPRLEKTIENMQNLNVAPDVHVKRVFYRSGLSNSMNTSDILKSAKEHLPRMPMALDSAFFIGREYCKKTKPNCRDCYLNKATNDTKICLRRKSE